VVWLWCQYGFAGMQSGRMMNWWLLSLDCRKADDLLLHLMSTDKRTSSLIIWGGPPFRVSYARSIQQPFTCGFGIWGSLPSWNMFHTIFLERLIELTLNPTVVSCFLVLCGISYGFWSWNHVGLWHRLHLDILIVGKLHICGPYHHKISCILHPFVSSFLI